MSIDIQQSFTQDEFNDLLQTKLDNRQFAMYKKLFTDCYKRQKSTNDFILSNDISDEKRNDIYYVLNRIEIESHEPFESLSDISQYFHILLMKQNYILLFAFNGTGKTRLSTEFKLYGKQNSNKADTLYYNAFTEDLFFWENDFMNDTERVLKYHNDSHFFDGLEELDIESRIRKELNQYADFYFDIKFAESKVIFSRDVLIGDTMERISNIKISRGEENIFIWCFFLAIVRLISEKEESYNWVKYIYIDDPISSLDDNNAIALAYHLVQVLKLCKKQCDVKIVISTHHALFFNVLCNEIENPMQYYLQRDNKSDVYVLEDTKKTPFFHHIALLQELKKASDEEKIYKYHFNLLRNILEKTASFHGYHDFSTCIKKSETDNIGIHTRMINLMNHGNYSLFDTELIDPVYIKHFKIILKNFIEEFKFRVN